MLCEGRVVIVTGAGRGIGRGEALEFAHQGAKVVVNDVGVSLGGETEASTPAEDVVAEILAAGGEAVANHEDVADFDGAKRLVQSAVEHFGDLHVVVNNAGIVRDRLVVNMEPDEWDAVIRVHLRGTFAVSRHAAAYWREQSKRGVEVDARLINTSSASGLYGNFGQANYGAAKAGIGGFTIVAAMELERYGIMVNAIAPAAATRMNEGLSYSEPARLAWEAGSTEFVPLDPENIAPLVVWLGSTKSRGITGEMFNVIGGEISIAERWHAGPAVDKGARWDPAELGDVIPGLVAASMRHATTRGDGRGG